MIWLARTRLGWPAYIVFTRNWIFWGSALLISVTRTWIVVSDAGSTTTVVCTVIVCHLLTRPQCFDAIAEPPRLFLAAFPLIRLVSATSTRRSLGRDPRFLKEIHLGRNQLFIDRPDHNHLRRKAAYADPRLRFKNARNDSARDVVWKWLRLASVQPVWPQRALGPSRRGERPDRSTVITVSRIGANRNYTFGKGARCRAEATHDRIDSGNPPRHITSPTASTQPVAHIGAVPSRDRIGNCPN
jgi:hypothetical protein